MRIVSIGSMDRFIPVTDVREPVNNRNMGGTADYNSYSSQLGMALFFYLFAHLAQSVVAFDC